MFGFEAVLLAQQPASDADHQHVFELGNYFALTTNPQDCQSSSPGALLLNPTHDRYTPQVDDLDFYFLVWDKKLREVFTHLQDARHLKKTQIKGKQFFFPSTTAVSDMIVTFNAPFKSSSSDNSLTFTEIDADGNDIPGSKSFCLNVLD